MISAKKNPRTILPLNFFVLFDVPALSVVTEPFFLMMEDGERGQGGADLFLHSSGLNLRGDCCIATSGMEMYMRV